MDREPAVACQITDRRDGTGFGWAVLLHLVLEAGSGQRDRIDGRGVRDVHRVGDRSAGLVEQGGIRGLRHVDRRRDVRDRHGRLGVIDDVSVRLVLARDRDAVVDEIAGVPGDIHRERARHLGVRTTGRIEDQRQPVARARPVAVEIGDRRDHTGVGRAVLLHLVHEAGLRERDRVCGRGVLDRDGVLDLPTRLADRAGIGRLRDVDRGRLALVRERARHDLAVGHVERVRDRVALRALLRVAGDVVDVARRLGGSMVGLTDSDGAGVDLHGSRCPGCRRSLRRRCRRSTRPMLEVEPCPGRSPARAA